MINSIRDYRYGFNGAEKVDEVSGEGNTYDLGLRMYNARLGRIFKVDPRTSEYPWQSPYVYHRNNPIAVIDYHGGGDGPDDVAADGTYSQMTEDAEGNNVVSTIKVKDGAYVNEDGTPMANFEGVTVTNDMLGGYTKMAENPTDKDKMLQWIYTSGLYKFKIKGIVLTGDGHYSTPWWEPEKPEDGSSIVFSGGDYVEGRNIINASGFKPPSATKNPFGNWGGFLEKMTGITAEVIKANASKGGGKSGGTPKVPASQTSFGYTTEFDYRYQMMIVTENANPQPWQLRKFTFIHYIKPGGGTDTIFATDLNRDTSDAIHLQYTQGDTIIRGPYQR